MQLKPNTLLQGGKYRIVKELGSGGFGITYKAVQVALNRYVAIKEFFMKDFCVRGSSSTQMSVGSEGSRRQVERYRKKFLKEARTIAQFKHPHIIGIHDVFEENGTAYYVMDFLEEGSLNDYLKKQGRLSETEALYYIRQIASALDYIHQQNINHLDVKPGNIMLDEKHNAVLIDFGLAKSYDGDGNQESTTPVGVSAGYAPTEQYMRGGVGKFSPETDIYSLGATLYKLVTGKTPPEAQEVTDYGLPAFPSFVSRQVASAITQAMQPRRVDRPQNCPAFLELLKKTFTDEETGTARQPLLFKWKIGIGIFLLIVAVVFLFKFTGSEDPYSLWLRGKDAYYKKEYKEAFRFFEQSANLGYAEAQDMVGTCYYFGEGVEKNYAEAIKWYRKAAEQEWAPAIFSLGCCYARGEGVAIDKPESVRLYRKAAELGHATAQFNLGNDYYFGEGVEKDYTEAFKWFKKAAEQNQKEAMYNLGVCYEYGEGVAMNYSEALKWYRKAANQGHADAQFNLGGCYASGLGVDQSHSEAFKWYHKAADQGHMDAQFNLGFCYDNGQGVAENQSEAARWYRKAAEQGDENAQYVLGFKYEFGDGVPQNKKEALKWYRKAAEQGLKDAEKRIKKLTEPQCQRYK